MKTLNYMVAIATAATLLMSSCRNKTKTEQDFGEIDNIIEENNITVKQNSVIDTLLNIGGKDVKFSQISRIANIDDSNQYYLSIRAIVPTEESAVTDSLYHTILDYFSMICDPTGAFLPLQASTPLALAEAIDAMCKQFTIEVNSMLNWEEAEIPGYLMDIDVRPVYGTDRYLTYSIFCDSYTGGAHGNIDTYFETFDPATGKPYTFETLFTPDGQKEIRHRLVEIIAADKEMSESEYLTSVNEFVMSDTPITADNFPIFHVGITSLGAIFSYPKYSIAAGFEGCPTYVIPTDEITPFLSK